MQIDERMIVKGLISSQIDSIRGKITNLVDDFYDKYNPVRSLVRSYITDLISCLNDFLYSIGEPYDN